MLVKELAAHAVGNEKDDVGVILLSDELVCEGVGFMMGGCAEVFEDGVGDINAAVFVVWVDWVHLVPFLIC